MAELIVVEKPMAAKKLADALAEGKVKKESIKSVPFYRIKHAGKEIIIGAAVGHLYGLEQKAGEKWGYPVFEVSWEPGHKSIA